jgi:hypothetical protein
MAECAMPPNMIASPIPRKLSKNRLLRCIPNLQC